MIDKTLERLGLRDEEIKTFLFLLENGEQTAGNLAKKTGLSRPSLYGFLQKLQKSGLVVESQKNGVKIFHAVSQEKVQAVLDEQIIELEKGKLDIVKLFSEIQKGENIISPKFQLFDGKEGLQQILKDMLLYRDIETKAYWPIKSMVELLGENFFTAHNKERIARRIYTRAIWPENQSLDIKKHPYLGTGEKFFREIRTAPKEIDFSMGYWIYGNKVACISSKKESFGFIIESKEFAEMMTSQFKVVWKISKMVKDSN
jgi:HTH-type transcriptional regulator, sugar sensing transcriptional regulator